MTVARSGRSATSRGHLFMASVVGISFIVPGASTRVPELALGSDSTTPNPSLSLLQLLAKPVTHGSGKPSHAAVPKKVASRSSGHSRRLQRRHSTRHERGVAQADPTPQDIEDTVTAAIDKTYGDVNDTVDSVNSTIMGVVELIGTNSHAVESALDALLKVANTLRSVVGQDLVNWVESFVGRVKSEVEKINTSNEDVKLQVQAPLNAILSDFGQLRDEVVDTYNKSAFRIKELADACAEKAASDSANATTASDSGDAAPAADSGDAAPASFTQLDAESQAQTSQGWNPIDWLKHLFGGGRHHSSASKVMSAVDAANATADHVAEYLVKLNSTLDVLLVEVQDRIAQGIQVVNASYIDAMAKASDIMTPQIKTAVDQAMEKTLGLVGTVEKTLASAVNDLQKKLDGASEDMAPLYDATNQLLELGQSCLEAAETAES